MTSTELATDSSKSGNRAGVYLAFLQLVFTLGWTTYVIYLLKLAAQVGIAPTAAILVLMMDQAIFTITDTAMGIAADRIAALVGRLGMIVAALTALSCAALPFVASAGGAASAWQIFRQAKDSISRRARHARLWPRRRRIALSRRGAAR
jgi:hypothetical protein